jgi:CRP-like cAMP-binding protein
LQIPSSSLSESQLRNRLLAALPADAAEFIGPKLATSHFTAGQVVCEKNDPITEAVFPHDCVLSVMAVMDDGRSALTTTIGIEGCLGFASGIADRRAINRCVVQIGGSASLLPLDWLGEAVDRYPAVYDLQLRYVKAVLAKMVQSVACTSLHTVDLRCCRRLLMLHDRVVGDSFQLKQEYMAQMLGVRRATIGEICARLQGAGIIRYSRGTMTILDRSRLENASCECYGESRRIFEQLLPKTYEP